MGGPKRVHYPVTPERVILRPVRRWGVQPSRGPNRGGTHRGVWPPNRRFSL